MSEKPDLDYVKLDRMLDRVKTRVFLGKSAAFLGPLMCSMSFIWDEGINTAATDGINLWWNPHFFLALKPEVRETILLHELWHPGFLHMVRRGDRDPHTWNVAADIVINNMLKKEGYSFEGVDPCIDPKYEGWGTEAVYDDLINNSPPTPKNLFTCPGSGQGDQSDIEIPASAEEQKAIERIVTNNVVSAAHSAALAGEGAGDIPGEVQETIKRFLSPKLPWEQILRNFFNELENQDYSWARPNRRYQDIYLPSLVDDREGLDHLIYFLDVSGSISENDIVRFHSEFKYVKETFQPEKMTMVQFDTRIQKEDEFLKDDPFMETHVIGRGGTCLICVRDYIIKHQPTAVVIFSDLQVTPMQPLPNTMNVPIIWVALNNRGATVPHGDIVHINE